MSGLLTLGLGFGLAGCTSPPPQRPSDLLNATLWQQQAHEYEASTRTLYAGALQRLRAALASCHAGLPGGCEPAALEQRGLTPAQLAALPPAVILDLDETVLDNSPFEATLQQTGEDFDEPRWAAWIAASALQAGMAQPRYRLTVPGALAFAVEAERLGAAVFYVSNRSCPPAVPGGPAAAADCATLRHTQALMQQTTPPFPRASDASAFLLMVDGQPSDKTARRQAIAAKHRIVMLIGDDLGDFVGRTLRDDLRRGTAEPELRDFAQRQWGHAWFMLPNAMYGSWEYFLTAGSRCPTAAEVPDAVARGRQCRQGRIEDKDARLTGYEPRPELP